MNTEHPNRPTLATSATITRKSQIIVDGVPLPFHVGDDVTLKPIGPREPVNRIHVTILVDGPVVLEGDRGAADSE